MKSVLEHEVSVLARRSGIPSPATYMTCITHPEAVASKIASQSKPTTAQVKRECETLYHGLTQRAMASLISSEWITQEAVALGLTVNDRDVAKRLDEQKRESFNTASELQKYLNQSGRTLADLRSTVRVELTTARIEDMIARKVGDITRAQMVRYYHDHKQRFVVPERRDIQAIRTWTKAAIKKAEREVRSGVAFASVARRVSIDRPYNEKGGVMTGIVPGQEEAGFDEAIFTAKRNVLTGPLHLRKRYYLFQVTKIQPSRQKALAQVQAAIEHTLSDKFHRDALASFVRSWRKTWATRTNCRPGYVISRCRQYVKTKAAPSENPYILE